MRANPQNTADFFTFTKGIFNGKLHFFVQCHYIWRDIAEAFITFLRQYEVS